MKTSNASRAQAAFTMVEIAICLGVIAIALVAILGVLPTGTRVQKDNREETIVEQDAKYILEAIRGGPIFLPTFQMGLKPNIGDMRNTLTNLVEKININGGPVLNNVVAGSITPDKFISFLTMTNALGLAQTNRAIVRSMAGPLATMSRNQALKDMSFRYRVDSTVAYADNAAWDPDLRKNMHLLVVHLEFHWPVRPDGSIGAQAGTGSPKVYNLLVNGTLGIVTNGVFIQNLTLENGTNFFRP